MVDQDDVAEDDDVKKGVEQGEKESADKAGADEPVEAPKRTANTSAPVQFSRTVSILPNTPMSDFDLGRIKAYQANDDDQKGISIAYVCEKDIAAREFDKSVYQNMINSTFIQFKGAGPRYWPPAGEERYIIVYSFNLGDCLLGKGQAPTLGMRLDIMMRVVVEPLITALQDMRDSDFFHGAINPTNMFMASGGEEKIVLGDCLAAPPGYTQPVLYEPIERAMMAPVSKGKGTSAEDIYSFGVSLAVIMRTIDPMEGLSDDDIIKHKIEHGSYASLLGNERFQGPILELLRGVLHDNPAERWGVDEITAWQDGRRLTPKQAMKSKKTPRPLEFLGEKYYQLPILAMDVDRGPDELQELVESDVLETWLTRALEDVEALDRVEEGISLAAQNGIGPYYADKLVNCLSLAMFPMSPIRFKGMRIGGGGVGSTLLHVMATKKDVTAFKELFLQKVTMDWLNLQQNPSVDAGRLVNIYDNCRGFLHQNRVGFGIERCLYVLCPEAHCLSDILSDYFVTSSEHMLRAFEHMCQNGRAPDSFLDRHTIAFLSVKDSKVIDPFLYDLNAKDEHKRLVAELKVLAGIQRLAGEKDLFHIAKHFMAKMQVIYQRFHDKEIIEKVDKNVKKYVDTGDLHKLSLLIDNPDLVAKDLNAFRYAMHEYKTLQNEATDLEQRLEDKATYGLAAGRQISSLVASILALMIILFMAAISLSGKLNF